MMQVAVCAPGVHKAPLPDLEDPALGKPALLVAEDWSACRGLDVGPNLLEEGVNVEHRHLAGLAVAAPPTVSPCI